MILANVVAESVVATASFTIISLLSATRLPGVVVNLATWAADALLTSRKFVPLPRRNDVRLKAPPVPVSSRRPALAGGTIDMANLPAAIGTILYQTPATADVTINDVTSTLTVNTEDNAEGGNLTVGAVGPNPGFNDILNVIVGDAIHHTTGHIGNVTVTGEEIVNFTSQGAVSPASPPTLASANTIGTVLLTPTLTGSEHVTITGDTDIFFGTTGGGAIFSVNAAGNNNVNNLSITDTNSLGTYFEAPVGAGIPPYTFIEQSYSTNAALIDATHSGTGGTIGLVMRGGDANWLSDFTVGNTVINPNSAGDTISGSLTASNILIGSLGNDTINGNTSSTVADTIGTNGGADTINLAANHTASDHIELFAGTAGLIPGVAETGIANSIINVTGGVASSQQGFWGNSPGVNFGLPALNFTGSGTSADLSTINNFNPTHDVIDLSIGAWGGGFLSDTTTASLTPGNATFTNSVGPGETITTTGSVIFISQGSFLNAATLAGVLASASGGITTNNTTALANGGVEDIILETAVGWFGFDENRALSLA